MSHVTHVVDGRTVLTLCAPWPVALLTGYEDAGGIVVEHCLSFRPGFLLPLIRAGMAEVRRRGYQHVRARLPKAFPLTARLVTVATRAGFLVYREDDDSLDMVWRP